MTQPMDVERIRRAVRGRYEVLRDRCPELTLTALADRMDVTTKTVDNLVNGRPKRSFRLLTLRRASRALEWPDDALERIAAGDVSPAELPECPWDVPLDVPDRLAQVEARQEDLHRQMAAVRDDLQAGLRAVEGILCEVRDLIRDRD